MISATDAMEMLIAHLNNGVIKEHHVKEMAAIYNYLYTTAMGEGAVYLLHADPTTGVMEIKLVSSTGETKV